MELQNGRIKEIKASHKIELKAQQDQVNKFWDKITVLMNEKEELENNLRNVNPPSYPSPSYNRVVIQDDLEMQSKEDALKEKELAVLEK